MPNADRDTKSVLELKKTQRTIQLNINRLYKICDALYEEIHNIKHFVNYKAPTLEASLGDRTNGFQKQQVNPMSVLDNIDEFTMPQQQSTGSTGRKLKIIDN